MNNIIIIDEPVIIKRGRPLGRKNITSIEEYNNHKVERKKQIQANFQRYKSLHHDELKQVYLNHYYTNRDAKLNRMKTLYHCKKHLQSLMAIEA